jgi:uncharacterized iron-regulated membrane protein
LNLAFWRRWHRWIGFPAAVFLLFAAATGMILAFTEFFGEEEALREAARDLVSPVTLASPAATWSEPIARAVATVATAAGSAPIDKITIQFKGEHPTIQIFTGEPKGGEDRQFILDEKTGALVRTDAYVDKPFINRLHSGEAFGDGGLLVATFWALSLIVLTLTGLIIYFKLMPRVRTGI